ncbi:hypothetical protein KEM60_02716 [Austwickia sp. TVS 96-490-7B]|uniref:hypothetical protein n=1 Tax=Austwickia sp. TVS 96-490-7B TaxID=2830843 RepID=UPI001C564E75|nr:hypothetical protein [Austwickia sp. TVS 96-490-7B]MBW3086495.1 hypothetical protein [Austwickia sp. TVS 96-490-7B]
MPSLSDTQPPLALSEDRDIRRFADELGTLWPELQPWARPWGEEESARLHELYVAATRHARTSDASIGSVLTRAGDLGALRAGWPHFTSGQKAVLNAATAYVVLVDEPVGVPTATDTTVDRVVSAAVRALLRH